VSNNNNYRNVLATVRLGSGLMVVCCLSLVAGCGWVAHGDNVEGVRLYQQAAYTDPNNADGYYNLAATYHRQGKLANRQPDLQQAESYYHQCLDHDPDHVECYRALAVLLVEEGRSEEAFKLLENWAQHSPTLADPKIELARMFEEFGDKDAAKSHLLEALTVAPNDPRALAALGKLREEGGDHGQALVDYQRSLAQNRFQPQVASRVSTLQTVPITAGVVTPPDGTRMVTVPPASSSTVR
jgi:tetratricopeptide (TPR) repeat protein